MGAHRTLRARNYDLLIHLTEHPRGVTLAHLLRPRYRHARRPRSSPAVGVPHFYKLPKHAAPRGRSESRRTAAYQRLSEAADEGRAGPGRIGRRVDACCASTASTRADSSTCIRLALDVQVCVGRAIGRALRADRSIGPPRRDHRRARRASARSSTRFSLTDAPTRTRIVDLTGALSLRSSPR
jgi:hypothetical protein